MKQHILLVDRDVRSRRLLEVSLRKAGYTVTAVDSAEDALAIAKDAAPDLVLSDTQLGDVDGFALVTRLRELPELRETPLVFLSSDTSIASKVRGLELGVEYLTKPIYIREVLTRVGLELDRASRKIIELRAPRETRFSGSLADMALVDLLQTIDVSRKSGTMALRARAGDGMLWFERGQVIDAAAGELRGEAALYRFLTWGEGQFEMTFGDVDRKATIALSTQALLMEGMRRVDEWGRLVEQLPELDAVLEVNERRLVDKLASLPDEANTVLRTFDGVRTLRQVLALHGEDELGAMRAVAELVFEGVLEPAAVTLARAEGAAQVGASGGAAAVRVPVVSGAAPASASPRFSEPPKQATGAAISASGTLLQFPAVAAGGATQGHEAEPSPGPKDEAHGATAARTSERPRASERPQPSERPSQRPSKRPVHDSAEEEGFFSERVTVHDDGAMAWDERAIVDSVRPSTGRHAWAAVATVLALLVLGGSLYAASRIMTERETAAVDVAIEPPVHRPPPAELGGAADVGSQAAEPTAAEPAAAPGESPAAPPPENAAPAVEPLAAEPAAAEPTAPAAEPAAAQPPPTENAREELAAPGYADLLRDAEAASKKGRAKQAEDAYRAALLVDPKGPEAVEGLAFLLLNRGKNKEAAELAASAAALNPASSRAWITLGAALQALGKTQEARAAYARCVSEGQGPFVRDCRLMLR